MLQTSSVVSRVDVLCPSRTLLTTTIEQAAEAIKEATPNSTSEAKGKANEAVGQAKGKAAELKGEASKKAGEVEGEINKKL